MFMDCDSSKALRTSPYTVNRGSISDFEPHSEFPYDGISIVESARATRSGIGPKIRNIVVLDKKRVMELERELTETKTALKQASQQHRFVQSRNMILERSLLQHRRDMKTLLNKDEINNQLIAELRKTYSV